MNKPVISFRKATIDDLALLKHWDQQPHVIASDPEDEWNWDQELLHDPPWRTQLIAELQTRPIGFLQIIDPAAETSKYWGGIGNGFRAIDIWIGEAYDLGKGYGTVMMNLAIEQCFQDQSVHTIIIDPLSTNKAAIRFYRRLGFEFLEEKVFGNDRCSVYQLTRGKWLQKDQRQ